MSGSLKHFQFALTGMIILFAVKLHAQSDPQKWNQPSAGQQNTFFTVEGTAFLSLSGGSPHPAGISVAGGFNIARFFSRNIVFGVFAEAKPYKGFLNKSFDPGFQTFFSEHYDLNASDHTDTLLGQYLLGGITGADNFQFVGNYAYHYGIMFSPFPNQHGGFMLKLRRGIISFPLAGIYDEPFDQLDFLLYNVVVDYGIDLEFKPLSFFRNTAWQQEERKFTDRIIAGVFAEQWNWEKSDFQGMPVGDIVDSEFFTQYHREWRFGFRLGVGIY